MTSYEWFTLREIAELNGLSYGYLRQLASKHPWRRTTGKPRLYHIRDVMGTIKSAKD